MDEGQNVMACGLPEPSPKETGLFRLPLKKEEVAERDVQAMRLLLLAHERETFLVTGAAIVRSGRRDVAEWEEGCR